MKKFLKKFVLSSSIALTLLTILFPAFQSPLHAQQAEVTTLIPPSFELFANPGDALSEKLQIRNEGETDIMYNFTAQNFEAEGDTGQVALTSGDSTKTFSLASWITMPIKSLDIKPHTEKDVTYSVSVPLNAEPGGHYGAIVVSSAAGTAKGAADVSSGQVSLILLRVSGNVQEKAIVKSFTAPSYSEYGPITFSLEGENQGDVHIKPTGTIVITDIFGAKVAEIPLTERNILPGAARRILTDWTAKNPIGRFKATLVANYGEKHEPLVAEVTFIVFPKPLAIGLGVTLIIVVILIGLLISGRKRIAKAFKVIAQG